MPSDREVVLDELLDGLSIDVVARRFDRPEDEVHLKRETERIYDGEEMRAEWTLTARRLRRMELKLDRKAIDHLDCVAAAIALKASERQATLCGANGHPIVSLRSCMLARSRGGGPRPTSLSDYSAIYSRTSARTTASSS
jgi:hypothetical protein